MCIGDRYPDLVRAGEDLARGTMDTALWDPRTYLMLTEDAALRIVPAVHDPIGAELPPVVTWNPRVLDSSEPTPEEPVRRGGLGQTLSTGSPLLEIQGEPLQKILRSTLLHSAVSYTTNAVSSRSPTTAPGSSFHRAPPTTFSCDWGRDEDP